MQCYHDGAEPLSRLSRSSLTSQHALPEAHRVPGRSSIRATPPPVGKPPADHRGEEQPGKLLTLNIMHRQLGVSVYKQHGTLLQDETLADIAAADATLFGAIGGDGYDEIPREIKINSGLLSVRGRLGMFANLRPVIAFDALGNVAGKGFAAPGLVGQGAQQGATAVGGQRVVGIVVDRDLDGATRYQAALGDQ